MQLCIQNNAYKMCFFIYRRVVPKQAFFSQSGHPKNVTIITVLTKKNPYQSVEIARNDVDKFTGPQ